MAKTDRQTDKGTWWSVTGYNDEIGRLENPDTFPPFVKKVYGGREECPKTKRLHFQGAIHCNRQVRLSQFKEWLPTAHLEVARQSEALKKYAMKEDTAVGEKTVTSNTRTYWPMEVTLSRIGEISAEYDEREWNETQRFWFAVKRILRKDPTRCATLANPALLNMWKNTHNVWESEETRALVLQPETDGGDASPESEE